MIFLIPFLNCFLLYICMEKGQIFNKWFVYYKKNIVPKITLYTSIPFEPIGGCVLCTSFWMGFVELIYPLTINSTNLVEFSILLAYNAVSTLLLYKVIKSLYKYDRTRNSK